MAIVAKFNVGLGGVLLEFLLDPLVARGWTKSYLLETLRRETRDFFVSLFC
jgi:hypothetical protein